MGWFDVYLWYFPIHLLFGIIVFVLKFAFEQVCAVEPLLNQADG